MRSFLAVFVGLIACGGDESPEPPMVVGIHLDHDLCLEEQRAALYYWAGHGVFFDETLPPRAYVEIQSPLRNSGVVGKAMTINGSCLVAIWACNYELVAHELGHCLLGGSHVNDPQNLMYPYIGTSLALTERQKRSLSIAFR